MPSSLLQASQSPAADEVMSSPVGHRNWMDGISYDVSSPLAQLRMAAASCFFGEPSYYINGSGKPNQAKDAQPEATSMHVRLANVLGEVVPAQWSGMTTGGMLEQAVDAALDYDAESTLRIAVALRHEDHIRVTPQVIMVRAANHAAVRGTDLIRKFAPHILTRADEPALQLAYQLRSFGQPIPNSLKKAWKVFLEGRSEHQLAKYRMEKGYRKTLDVVNLVHAHSAAIDKLMKGELKLEESTWESLISAKGSTKETWTEARDRFFMAPQGHMALLRNLRNLDSFGLVDDKVIEALKAGVLGGRQLPFRYWSAYNALREAGGASGKILDAVEQCLIISLEAVPRFEGRVASLCDNSGSAQEACTSELGTVHVNHIANLTGVLTGMVSDEGYVGVFGDELKMFPVRKGSSVFDQAQLLNREANSIGAGTENGIWLFWDKAIRERQHWDHVFVYSDMQAGHGGLYGTNPRDYEHYRWDGTAYIDVPRLVADYRRAVNPNVMVYLVQVAGYKDTLMPDVYDRTVVLGGWGPGLLRYAKALADIHAVKAVPAEQV